MLLEHPGEIVSREELRNRLWQRDTFVDFDYSLNTAIMRLREVLGDSSENPIFIETLSRRGYRFIAPVEELAAQTALMESAVVAREHEPAWGFVLRPHRRGYAIGIWLCRRPGCPTTCI